MTRPILVIGPLADAVIDKLTSDYPHKFVRCEPEFMNCNQEALEKGILDNLLIDFRRRGSHYECTTVSAIKEIGERVSCFKKKWRREKIPNDRIPNALRAQKTSVLSH